MAETKKKAPAKKVAEAPVEEVKVDEAPKAKKAKKEVKAEAPAAPVKEPRTEAKAIATNVRRTVEKPVAWSHA